MTPITLPPRSDGSVSPELPATRQISLVGAPGAGKSRFMRELVTRCGERAYRLSAVGCRLPSPDGADSEAFGSIDALYREAARQRPYMRTDAVSPLDKLSYMIFADEFDSLLSLKAAYVEAGEFPDGRPSPTPLDRLSSVWSRVFPGNRIVTEAGRLMFATTAGDDLIPASSLSEGEAAVLYYVSAVLYAMPEAIVFIESPSLFMHPTIVSQLWNAIEELRPDCTFVYDSVDVDFVASRTQCQCLWIKNYDAARRAWDYELLPSGSFSDDMFVDLIGARKPVLFIEGDAVHSIDARLYPLVFTDYHVRPLGSCNKVIETVRTFNDQKYLHHLDSHGIVDRDRRTDEEVAYLRRKGIFVPEVAEVENIFLLPDVVAVMADVRGRDPERVVAHVRRQVFAMFHSEYRAQALQHVRHRVKREVECKIDARFTCITAMEMHLSSLVDKLRPREQYNTLISDFHRYLQEEDYEAVLKVFNHKPMLANCGVAQQLGFATKDDYIRCVLGVLKGSRRNAERLREAVKRCFGLTPEECYIEPLPPRPERKRRTAKSPHVPGQGDRPRGEPVPEAESRRRRNHRRKRRKGRSRKPDQSV